MAIKSKGKRPFIVRMPNEPSPLRKSDWENVFEYRGGNASDPHNYANFEGKTIVEYVMDNSNGRKREIEEHVFRSKETMINWLLRNGFAATDIPEGIYVDVNYASSNYGKWKAEHNTEKHRHWMEGNVYAVASIDDPLISEGMGDTIYLDSPKQLPPGAIFKKDYGNHTKIFYGNEAETYVRAERANAASKDTRRYIFEGKIEDLTHEQAIMLGLYDGDIDIGERLYVGPIYDNKGPGNVDGRFIRMRNIRPRR